MVKKNRSPKQFRIESVLNSLRGRFFGEENQTVISKRVCVIGLSLGFFMLFLLPVHAEVATNGISSPAVILKSPDHHQRLRSGTVQFQWEVDGGSGSPGAAPEYFEVMFWSKYRDFSLIRTVYPTDSTKGSFRVLNVSDRFRKHGRYLWQVKVITKDGHWYRSDIREFVIPVPKEMKSMLPAQFPYAIKWQQTKRLSGGDFKYLMNNVYPKTHLESHSDISLIFRQPFVANYNIDLEEQLLFNTNVGIGGAFSVCWRLYENIYFALHPTASMGVCWFATGLERYSSIRYETYTGLDFVINPKGFISSNIRWIPSYRFHYAEKDDGFRVFNGAGWEWGVKVTIPRTIMTPFEMLGFEIDFERMPIEYTYSRVKDDYTKVVMPTQEIGISFLFH